MLAANILENDDRLLLFDVYLTLCRHTGFNEFWLALSFFFL